MSPGETNKTNKNSTRTRFSRRHGTDAQRKLGTDAGKLLASSSRYDGGGGGSGSGGDAAERRRRRRCRRRRRRSRRVGAGAGRSPIIGYLKMPSDCFSSSPASFFPPSTRVRGGTLPAPVRTGRNTRATDNNNRNVAERYRNNTKTKTISGTGDVEISGRDFTNVPSPTPFRAIHRSFTITLFFTFTALRHYTGRVLLFDLTASFFVIFFPSN